MILGNPYCINIISRCRVGYGPSLSWAESVWAEFVMGRVCHGPSLLWAELSSYQSIIGEKQNKQFCFRSNLFSDVFSCSLCKHVYVVDNHEIK